MGVPVTCARYAQASAPEKIVLLNARGVIEQVRYGGHSVSVLREALELEREGRERKGVLQVLEAAVGRRS